MHNNAIILLSGGLDSATVLAMAKKQGYRLHALSFNYGQRHQHELECAKILATQAGAVEHRIIDIDLGAFGHCALTDATIDVPKDRDDAQMSADIPITYVPARNTIFLSYALAFAEILPAADIFIGVNALDYSGYPDCRPAFIDAFETMANLGTKCGAQGQHITLHAPLIHMSKAQIIQQGLALGVDYGLTTSCYDPNEAGHPCGACDACILRHKGFDEAGAVDPAEMHFSPV